MSIIYRSPYEAYPFYRMHRRLTLRFEIYTDKVASMTGMLIADVMSLNLERN